MKDQEDFHGDISLAPTEATKTLKNPKSLKTVGFMPEEDVLLEEIISKINERFDGIFSEGDRVIVETLCNRAKKNKKQALYLKSLIKNKIYIVKISDE